MSTRASVLTTTCFFHAGGFLTPLELTENAIQVCFNHSEDLDLTDTCEAIYKEIDQFKPNYLMFGSHHLILLSNQPPKDKTLDLSSVYMVMPLGSTVPKDLYEILKKPFPNLVCCFNVLGMTEISTAFTMTNTVKHLGGVGAGSVLKLVDPETGKLCGPGEVGEILIKPEAHTNGK